jgi:hypothetical protein
MQIKIKLKEAFHMFNYLTARKLRGISNSTFLLPTFDSIIPRRESFFSEKWYWNSRKKYEKVMCLEVFFIGVARRDISRWGLAMPNPYIYFM